MIRETDTVSMKIITVVTLFFLPGTFISVRLFVSSSLVSYRSLPYDVESIVEF